MSELTPFYQYAPEMSLTDVWDVPRDLDLEEQETEDLFFLNAQEEIQEEISWKYIVDAFIGQQNDLQEEKVIICDKSYTMSKGVDTTTEIETKNTQWKLERDKITKYLTSLKYIGETDENSLKLQSELECKKYYNEDQDDNEAIELKWIQYDEYEMQTSNVQQQSTIECEYLEI